MRKLKRFAIFLLTLLLLSSLPAASVAGGGADRDPVPGGPAAVTAKDETVYARLSSGGEVQDIYVVNHFTLERGGLFSDYGAYSSVINLTDLNPLTVTDGTVRAQTAGEHFYYQGNLTYRRLPWLYFVEYRLNGTVIRPADLAGKSGRLEIRLTSSALGDPVSEIFYNNYMRQITFTLDNDTCSGITAGGAVRANAGKNSVFVFTILPKQDADITVTADVRDFEMAGIDITAMPYAMNIKLPAADGLLDDFALLAEALAELNDGAAKLRDGAAEITLGTEELRDGSSAFRNGLLQLSANSGSVTDASAQIMSALSRMTSLLGGAPDADGLERLPGALAQLAEGLDQISDGMRRLRDGHAQAYAALDKAVTGIPAHEIGEEQLLGLYAKADESERVLLARLMESYAAAMTVKGTYEQGKTAFMSVSGLLDTLSGSVDTISAILTELSGQISALSGGGITAQVRQLSEGISEVSEQYAAFHSGLVSYMQGVTGLAGSYSALNDGVADLNGGMAELSEGVSELSNGTGRLAAEISGLPGQFQHQIDSLISDYADAEFEPVSFASRLNEKTDFVQFVFRIEGIEKPKAEKSEAPETKQPGFWDRFMSLFGR
ncbi:MAG: hypothetical protein LBH95_00025 [Oscillospiraceae bacterium]|jgi:X-X-X-Leu-X-X-Gly heptad repeat protein|nr:hypothetical protein [Oscillospiraceae bacterium]